MSAEARCSRAMSSRTPISRSSGRSRPSQYTSTLHGGLGLVQHAPGRLGVQHHDGGPEALGEALSGMGSARTGVARTWAMASLTDRPSAMSCATRRMVSTSSRE